MNRASRILRTFAWAAVGFLVTNGVLLAFADAVDDGDYRTGVTKLVIGAISAAVAGLIAVFNVLRFGGESAFGKGVNQFIQMVAAGLATVGLADLTGAAAIDFVGAIGKVVVAALIGGIMAAAVNYSESEPPV